MDKPESESATRLTDSIQRCFAQYAFDFSYERLPPEVIDAAKARVIDTLGVLIAGFYSDPCRIARTLAAGLLHPDGATVIGTRTRITPDMAAFVNGITARYADMTDSYHWPGTAGGHPSDVITAILAVAEQSHVSGREFIAGVVLAYEAYLRLSDVFTNRDFDHTNFCCLGAAIAAGKLMGLTREQISQSISMAVVPNNSLRQARAGVQTMWRAAATGQAGRSGVFAAMLARAGMEGPHLPFEGKAGWCDHIARNRFSINADTLGGNGTPFKIMATRIKYYSTSGNTIPSILAAEKAAKVIGNITDISRVVVEVYRKTLEASGKGDHNWNPLSRETADHSVPYLVASTLRDGTITLRSFDEGQLWNADLRALMRKIEVVENKEFTAASERVPRENRARITVVTGNSGQFVAEASSSKAAASASEENAKIVAKFRSLTEDTLGAKRVDAILERLWKLEEVRDMAAIPPLFALS